jgi:hypothetical protein
MFSFLTRLCPPFLEPVLGLGISVNVVEVERHVVLTVRKPGQAEGLLVIGVRKSLKRHVPGDDPIQPATASKVASLKGGRAPSARTTGLGT